MVEATVVGDEPGDETAATSRTLLGVAAALLLAIGAPAVVLPDRSADWFGWTTGSPLAAAVAGALLWAVAACCVAAALAPRWVDARLAVPPLAAAGVAPLLAVLLEGVDALNDGWIRWVWLAVLAALPALAVAVAVAVLERGESPTPSILDTPSPVFSATIALQSSALVGTGAVALLDPERGARLWPWASSAIDARAIGALAVALGLVAAAAMFEGEQRRVRALGVSFVTAVVVIAAAAGRDASDVDWARPATVVIVLFLASLAASGSWALTAGREPTQPKEPRKKTRTLEGTAMKRALRADLKNAIRGSIFR